MEEESGLWTSKNDLCTIFAQKRTALEDDNLFLAFGDEAEEEAEPPNFQFNFKKRRCQLGTDYEMAVLL